MEFFQDIANSVGPFFKHLYVQIALLILFATVHGYVGAWLAVRMLFRPRKPVRILGLTIFPQGMIPRHRERLAAAIGKAVGEELVSQETIMEELLGKEFLRRKIRSVVESYAAGLVAQNYPSLIEALPGNMREPVLDTISTLQYKVSEQIEEFLRNEDSLAKITGFVERNVDELLSKRVSEVVDEDTTEKILEFIAGRLRSAVHSPALEAQVNDFISRRTRGLLNGETPLRDIFTEDAIILLKEKANDQVEPVIHRLTELAAAERTRDQIGGLIKREVHQYYEQLPFFKKIFVSRDNLIGEVDDLVNESLPKRIEETLKGDFFAAEARNFIDATIDDALARPVPELIGNIAPEQLERLQAQITRSVLALLQSPETIDSVMAYLRETFNKLRPHSIDAIMQTLYADSEEKLKQFLTSALLNVISRGETARIINAALSAQVDKLLSRPIGKIADSIPEEKLRSWTDSFADTIINAIQEKLPDAIREFDVGNVVREKINKYPVEKLESLVMSVAKEHLRTIELFGAFFGFLIGMVQAFLSYWAFAK